MKLEINSTNLMSWCDGQYANFSIGLMASEDFDLSVITNCFKGAAKTKDLENYLNDVTNFPDEQTQLLAILTSHLALMSASLERDSAARQIAEQMVSGFNLFKRKPSQVSRAFNRKFQESHDRDFNRPLEIEFDYSLDSIKLLKDQLTLDKMAVVLARLLEMPEGTEFDPYKLWADFCYGYASNEVDLLAWLYAIVLANEVHTQLAIILEGS